MSAAAPPSMVDLNKPVKPEAQHSGQVRMAYRLAEAYAGRLLHPRGLGWHYWDGHRWAEDRNGHAERAVLAVLRDAHAEAGVGGDKNPALRRDVQKSESAAGVRGVLELAAVLPEFAVTVSDLDPDPYLLNTMSGTLDLRTGELRPADPADRITKVTRGAYRPGNAEAGTWETFLARVLPDATVRDFLARLVGMALLGRVAEHVLPILTGTGANGKGTFYMAILNALGDYASTAEPDLFMHREGAHPTGEMDLMGRRLVVVSESDRDRKLAEATVKRLTGGDLIKARKMRQDFVEFTPSHTAFLVTNHLPVVPGDDQAIWRRLVVVPFDVVIPAAERDPGLDLLLQAEADAILAWAVAGYARYTADGLQAPEAVQVATSSYQLDSDALSRFVTERCTRNTAGATATAVLFTAWTKWCQAEQVDPGSIKRFGQELDRKGFPARRTRDARVREGLILQPELTDDDPLGGDA